MKFVRIPMDAHTTIPPCPPLARGEVPGHTNVFCTHTNHPPLVKGGLGGIFRCSFAGWATPQGYPTESGRDIGIGEFPSPPHHHGFTLIELVVVMAIIGLLLTIAVPRYMHSIDRGKVQVQRQNMAVMRDAIDKYYGDNGQYPETLDVLVTRHYLRSVPEDPVTGENKWAVIASPDDTKPGVYDVAPVSGTQLAAGEPASGAK